MPRVRPTTPHDQRRNIGDRRSIQDRPTAPELLEAVREFLERDVMTSTEGRTAFHARVAVNALGIVERELVLGPEVDAPVLERLALLLGAPDAPPAELATALGARIRDRTLDDRIDDVIEVVVALTEAKLTVANPRYLDDDPPEAGPGAGPGGPSERR